ncbi:MAG: calcium/proton exchanger [Thermomicrobiales bacterium]|nr:calcium/proton exchanger [Thermomicrobiales bacterium]
MPRWLYGMLVFGVGAIIAHFAGMSEILVFALAALGIIPISGLIGQATEALSEHVGPKWGGLLNATFGNAAELIIGIVAINRGLLDLVKASVTGSIIGNLLLVLGMGFLVGGWRHGVLRFDAREAGRNSAMMLIALASLLMPAAFAIADPHPDDIHRVSLGVSIVLIALYVAYIVYSLTSQGRQDLEDEVGAHDDEDGGVGWSLWLAIGVLVAATVATVILAELLVGTVEHVAERAHLSEFFVGIILVPIIGNVAEHFSAVLFAARNRADITQGIAAGSSTQVALLVAPLFVLLSYPLGNKMDLTFVPLEIIVVGMSALLFAYISADGESNWLEALQLLGLYVMAGVVFFFLPT